MSVEILKGIRACEVEQEKCFNSSIFIIGVKVPIVAVVVLLYCIVALCVTTT